MTQAHNFAKTHVPLVIFEKENLKMREHIHDENTHKKIMKLQGQKKLHSC